MNYNTVCFWMQVKQNQGHIMEEHIHTAQYIHEVHIFPQLIKKEVPQPIQRVKAS